MQHFQTRGGPKLLHKNRGTNLVNLPKKSALRSVFDPMHFKQLNAFYGELSLFKRSEKYID